MAAAVLLATIAVTPGSNGSPDSDQALLQRVNADPTDRQARLLLAQSLLEQGKDQAAFEVAGSILSARSEDGRAHLQAELLLQTGHPAEARIKCLGALRYAETAFGHGQLGRIYLAQRQYALAVEELNTACAMGLGTAELHRALATAYLGLGNVLGNVRPLTIVGGRIGELTGQGYIVDALQDGADSFLVAGPDSAVMQIRLAEDAGDHSLDLQRLAIQAWLAAQHYARAREICKRIEPRIDESDVSTQRRARFYEDFAEALFGDDRVEDFIERIRQAARLDPRTYDAKLGPAYQRAAQRCVQRGDLPGCIRYLELAVMEMPDSAPLHYRLANVYWEAGRIRDAARHWQITLQLDPDHDDRDRMLRLIQDLPDRH